MMLNKNNTYPYDKYQLLSLGNVRLSVSLHLNN